MEQNLWTTLRFLQVFRFALRVENGFSFYLNNKAAARGGAPAGAGQGRDQVTNRGTTSAALPFKAAWATAPEASGFTSAT